MFFLSSHVSLSLVCTESGLRDGTSLLSKFLIRYVMATALLGAVPLVGESLTPRYQGPLERLSREAEWPTGPSTLLWSSQSCAVFVSVFVLVLLGRNWEILKRLLLWDFCLGSVAL